MKGGAFVAHYGAEEILFEDNNMQRTCSLLSVGRDHNVVGNLVVRRNLFVRSTDTCEGDNKVAIKLVWVDTADVNNNTLVFPKTAPSSTAPEPDTKGIELAAEDNDSGSNLDVQNVDIWNNIIDHAHVWLQWDDQGIGNVRARNNFYFDRSNGAQAPSTKRHQLLSAGTFVMKKHFREFDESSTMADPKYVNPDPTTTYDLQCSGAAAHAGIRRDATRAWSSGTTYTSSTISPSKFSTYAVGWRQPTGCGSCGGWESTCSWLTSWRCCKKRPTKLFKRDTPAYGGSLVSVDSTEWTTSGTWNGQNEHVIGGSSGALALLKGSTMYDTEVAANVTLASGAAASGVVARGVDTNNYYAMRLLPGDGVDLVRKKFGATTTLDAALTSITHSVGYDLRLVVRGSDPVHLEGYLGATKVLDATDPGSSGHIVGSPGLLNGTSTATTFDDFEILEPETEETTAETLILTEDFSSCDDTDPPDPALWSVEGTYYCQSDRLRGESDEDLALLTGVDATNAEMRARVRLTNDATGSGVVARAANGAYYVARIERAGAVRLELVDGDGVTELAAYSTTIVADYSYRLELKAVGFLPVAHGEARKLDRPDVHP